MPLCAAFVELAAVIVTLPVEEGAVNTPAAVMLPALADHVKVATPVLLALHCDAVDGAMIAGVQETVTPPVVVRGAVWLDPPQPVNSRDWYAAITRRQDLKLKINRKDFIPRTE